MSRQLKLTRWYNAKGASLAPDVVYNSDDLQDYLEALINGDFVEWVAEELPFAEPEPEMGADGLGFSPLEDDSYANTLSQLSDQDRHMLTYGTFTPLEDEPEAPTERVARKRGKR